MKHAACLLLLSVLIIGHAFGQQKQMRRLPDDEYSWQYFNKLEQQLKLPDLTKTNKGEYWRFYFSFLFTTSVVIDLHYVNDTRCSAFVTLYTQEHIDTAQERATNRVYGKSFPLSESAALKILRQLLSLDINHIPTQMRDTITTANGYGAIQVTQYLDGSPPSFEYANDASCLFKICWKKPANDAAQTVFNTFKSLYDLKALTTEFEKHIPFQDYTSGWAFYKRPVTDKERAKYKAERDEYRKKNGL